MNRHRIGCQVISTTESYRPPNFSLTQLIFVRTETDIDQSSIDELWVCVCFFSVLSLHSSVVKRSTHRCLPVVCIVFFFLQIPNEFVFLMFYSLSLPSTSVPQRNGFEPQFESDVNYSGP